MNKKLVIGAGIAVLAIAMVFVLKTTVGDSKTELPGEENAENTLHIQENNGSSSANSSQGTESGGSSSGESGESGP